MIAAQQILIEQGKLFPELAAASTLAAAECIQDQFGMDEHLVLLICGGNDSLDEAAEYARLLSIGI